MMKSKKIQLITLGVIALIGGILAMNGIRQNNSLASHKKTLEQAIAKHNDKNLQANAEDKKEAKTSSEDSEDSPSNQKNKPSNVLTLKAPSQRELQKIASKHFSNVKLKRLKKENKNGREITYYKLETTLKKQENLYNFINDLEKFENKISIYEMSIEAYTSISMNLQVIGDVKSNAKKDKR